MPNPTHRHTKTRGRKRRTHYKAEVPSMGTCLNCGEVKLQHRVCASCGYYNGRSILTPKA